MSEILLTLHIIAAGTWIGANVVQLATANRVGAQGGAAAASWHDNVAWWGKVLYSPAAVVLDEPRHAHVFGVVARHRDHVMSDVVSW